MAQNPASIFELLPSDIQLDLLIQGLELMFARAQWPQASQIARIVLTTAVPGRLRAHALYLELRCQLRLGNNGLALEAFLKLLESAGTDQLLAQAIHQLAIFLLPERMELLLDLWLHLAALHPSVGLIQTGCLLKEHLRGMHLEETELCLQKALDLLKKGSRL